MAFNMNRFKINDILDNITQMNLKRINLKSDLNLEYTDTYKSVQDAFFNTNLKMIEDNKKILNKEEYFFTHSTTLILNYLMSIIRFYNIFENFKDFSLKDEKVLIDYYILGIISIPTKIGFSLSCLMEVIDIEYIKANNLWESGFEKINFQKEYYLIRKLLKDIQSKLKILYNHDLNLIEILLDFENSIKNIKGKRNSSNGITKILPLKNELDSSENRSFCLPKMEQLMITLEENLYSSCNQLITLFNTIKTIFSVYKEICIYENKMELKFSNDLKAYDSIVLQIKRYLFYPLCIKLFQSFFENISIKIIHINWEIDEGHILYNIGEANFYIQNFIEKISEVFENIISDAEIKNPLYYFQDFLEIICAYLNDKFIEVFSKIKKV